MFAGIRWTILIAFPVAGLFALVLRFPIPFSGQLSGPEAVGPAILAVLIYGILGGFVVLAALGAAAGAFAHKIATQKNRSVTPILLILCLAVDVALALVLASV